MSGFIAFRGASVFVSDSFSAPADSEKEVFTDCSVPLFAVLTLALFFILPLCTVALELGWSGKESLLTSTLGAG